MNAAFEFNRGHSIYLFRKVLTICITHATFSILPFIVDDLLVNVAAGNSGRYNELNTVGTPAVAKNILSVGSSQSADDGETSGVTPRQGGQEYVSDFSSRGTTADGRIKPDVV